MKIHNPQLLNKSSAKAQKPQKCISCNESDMSWNLHILDTTFSCTLIRWIQSRCRRTSITHQLWETRLCELKKSKKTIKKFAYRVPVLYIHNVGCRKIICRRFVSKFSSSRSVEITPKHGTAKLTLNLKLKVKFFRDHPNQHKLTNQYKPSKPNPLIETNQPKKLNPKQPTQLKPTNPNETT